VTQPRFEAIRLEYGCHAGRFELPEEHRPVVIAGRNGTGKTTLLEAFLRGLYGFSRRKPEERRLLELRQPWSGRPTETEVWLRAADGTCYAIHRDFAGDEVVTRDEMSEREVFRGDGNPAGVRSESRHYQDLLREWIGFGSLEPYRGTAWIAQGELVDTKLDDELLRAAAGTHRRVEVALKELREAFETLTLEPLELGSRRKNRPRDLENLREAVELGVSRLEVARAARERRRPLLERAGDARRDVEGIESEILLLEAAYRPITERRTLIAEEKEAERHLATLSDSIRWLREAAAELARAEADEATAAAGGRYPADFEARLGQAEVLWDRLEALEVQGVAVAGTDEAQPGTLRSTLTISGLGLMVTGSAIALTLSAGAGVLIGVSGLLLVVARLWMDRARRNSGARAAELSKQKERELAVVRSRLDSIAEGVPSPALTMTTVAEHRLRVRRQEAAAVEVLRARDRSEEAMDRAVRLLREVVPAGEPDRETTLHRLEAVQEEARTALARVQLRLEEQLATPVLPEGVEPTVAAVESAREDRRGRRDALREQFARFELELRDLDRASEDVFALEHELERLRGQVGETESEASVRRFAWELVRDAYEKFRSTDQDRLLSAVNRRLDELSGSRLGPVEAVGDLATAQVGLGGRSVALDSPPLSFGEKHIALFAIRLGAADFLAGEGTHHPLLVDEPFTHLDEVRSRQVWDLLQRLAMDRQVIVTTQDRLVLDHLGIEPDLDLTAPNRVSETEAPKDPAVSLVEAVEPPGKEPVDDPSPSAPAQAQLELG